MPTSFKRPSRLHSKDPADAAWRGRQAHIDADIDGLSRDAGADRLVADMEAMGITPRLQIERLKAYFLARQKHEVGGGHDRECHCSRPDRRNHQDEAAAVLATMELSLSDVFRLLLRRVAAEKALPFEPLVPNAETAEAIKAARRGDVVAVGKPSQLLASLNADC